ncbi:unnamed protein product [Euphydryas editha]|uniref:UDP-glucuronosyltransferase n=1 Tax=Euphydryas editha TaxID=104508 RepID=A0AAU9UGT0_EUPED|nr:unnamed protein product [Euphydryas editha]
MSKMLLVILISVFVGSECANILGVFILPLKSHHIVFRPLMLELAKHGHDVTVITTDPAYPKGQSPQNLTEIDLHDISYDYWNNFFLQIGSEKDSGTYFKKVFDLILNLVVTQLKSTEIQIFLNESKKIDLIFIESCARPSLVYSAIYKAPVIEISTLSGVFSAFETIGAATHPLIYPNPLHRRIYNLTSWEKIRELYQYYSLESAFAQHVHDENKILKTIKGLEELDINDIKRNVQMLFLNVHPVWDFNRPVPPNVLYLGGLHLTSPKELPKDLKTYLDSSKNGVIYMSFGTNVKSFMLPPEKLKIFIDVFSQIQYDVLWKWDEDELPERPKNVRLSKWLPQPDLLQHPKIKLFITQGGLQSTVESIRAGVPLIGVPILSDQYFNVEQYLKFNIGKRLILETLTHEELIDAIKTLISDDSYRQNVVLLNNVMNDQPQTPIERAVWWTEYVLRHDGRTNLRASGAGISWTKYYELESKLKKIGTKRYDYNEVNRLLLLS